MFAKSSEVDRMDIMKNAVSIALAAFVVMFCLFALPAPIYADPISEVHISGNEFALDEVVTLTVILKWRQSEGDYRFVEKDWDLKNLEFKNQGISDESYSESGTSWRRKTFKITFTPLEVGKATIRNIVLKYINISTQKTGSIQIPTSLNLSITEKKESGLLFVNLTILLFAIIVIGAFGFSMYSKSAAKHQAEAKVKSELAAYNSVADHIAGGIEGDQKQVLFGWAKEFKIFLTHHYQLSSSSMTESEVIDAIKKSGKLTKKQFASLENLYERLSNAKFAPKALTNPELKKLQSDLVTHIRGSQTQGNP